MKEGKLTSKRTETAPGYRGRGRLLPAHPGAADGAEGARQDLQARARALEQQRVAELEARAKAIRGEHAVEAEARGKALERAAEALSRSIETRVRAQENSLEALRAQAKVEAKRARGRGERRPPASATSSS